MVSLELLRFSCCIFYVENEYMTIRMIQHQNTICTSKQRHYALIPPGFHLRHWQEHPTALAPRPARAPPLAHRC